MAQIGHILWPCPSSTPSQGRPTSWPTHLAQFFPPNPPRTSLAPAELDWRTSCMAQPWAGALELLLLRTSTQGHQHRRKGANRLSSVSIGAAGQTQAARIGPMALSGLHPWASTHFPGSKFIECIRTSVCLNLHQACLSRPLEAFE